MLNCPRGFVCDKCWMNPLSLCTYGEKGVFASAEGVRRERRQFDTFHRNLTPSVLSGRCFLVKSARRRQCLENMPESLAYEHMFFCCASQYKKSLGICERPRRDREILTCLELNMKSKRVNPFLQRFSHNWPPSPLTYLNRKLSYYYNS